MAINAVTVTVVQELGEGKVVLLEVYEETTKLTAHESREVAQLLMAAAFDIDGSTS